MSAEIKLHRADTMEELEKLVKQLGWSSLEQFENSTVVTNGEDLLGVHWSISGNQIRIWESND